MNLVVRKSFFYFALVLLQLSSNSREALAKEQSVVNILMPAPFADSTKKIISEYNKKNKGSIRIKVTRGPLETESVSDLAISSLILEKSPFDIILMDVTWLPKYAASGWIRPLDDLKRNHSWDLIAEGAKLGNSYNGRIYRWPFVADMGLLYWRKDLLPNPPKTPDQLLKQSLRFIREGKVKYGYVWQGRQYEGLSCVFLEVINGFGGEWISKEGSVGLSNKHSIQAARWLRELISSGASPIAVTNYSETESLQAFASGQALFMRNWPYAWAELQKNKSPVKGKVGVTTMVSNNPNQSTSTLGSWGFSIPTSSRKFNEAKKVISFLTSNKIQKYLFLNYGYTPTHNSLFNDKELIKKFPLLKSLNQALTKTKTRPEIPAYAQISDVLQRQLSSIITGQSNPKKSMFLAERNTIRILNASGVYK